MCHRLPLLSLLLKTVFKSVLQKKRPTEGYFRFAFDLGDWHASGGFMNACVYGVQLLLNAWICICLMISYTVTLFFGKEYVNESEFSQWRQLSYWDNFNIFHSALHMYVFWCHMCKNLFALHVSIYLFLYCKQNSTLFFCKMQIFFFWHIVIYTYTSGKINKIKNANFISFASYWILKLSICPWYYLAVIQYILCIRLFWTILRYRCIPFTTSQKYSVRFGIYSCIFMNYIWFEFKS